jgi:hypothetical protein
MRRQKNKKRRNLETFLKLAGFKVSRIGAKSTGIVVDTITHPKTVLCLVAYALSDLESFEQKAPSSIFQYPSPLLGGPTGPTSPTGTIGPIGPSGSIGSGGSRRKRIKKDSMPTGVIGSVGGSGPTGVSSEDDPYFKTLWIETCKLKITGTRLSDEEMMTHNWPPVREAGRKRYFTLKD